MAKRFFEHPDYYRDRMRKLHEEVRALNPDQPDLGIKPALQDDDKPLDGQPPPPPAPAPEAPAPGPELKIPLDGPEPNADEAWASYAARLIAQQIDPTVWLATALATPSDELPTSLRDKLDAWATEASASKQEPEGDNAP